MHNFFWMRHPALLCAITLLISASATLFWPSPWNIIFPILWTSYLIFLKKWPALLLLPAMALYCNALYTEHDSGTIQGIFTISSIQSHRSPFHKSHIYRGTLYLPEGALPCKIHTQDKQIHRGNYFLQGRLQKQGPFDYVLKPTTWTSIPSGLHFPYWRYLTQEKYRHFLKDRFADSPEVADFFFALTTGELENRLMRYEFDRIGLQHILGVSGFHFALLAALCSFGLSLCLPRFWKWIILLFALSAYDLFISQSPAVERCWLMAVGYIGAKLCNRSTNGLNLLGFTMSVELIINPLVIPNIGFHLSFASCLGIFFFYSIYEKKLRVWLPKRPLEEANLLSPLSKHGYLLCSFLRQAISLTLAVNTVILPILLVHFHSFPPMSLLYNLFYPFLADATLFGLFVTLCLHLLSEAAAVPLFEGVRWIAKSLIDLASYSPPLFDRPYLTAFVEGYMIPFYLFLLFQIHLKLSKSKTCNDLFHFTNTIGYNSQLNSDYGGRSSVG